MKLQLGVFSESEYTLNGRFSLVLTILLFVFVIVKVHESELQGACTVISYSDNSVQANQAGTSAAKNPVPSQVSKPGRQKTGHRIEDERLYKALKKAVTEDQV